jgi:sarcosine oxidase
VRIGACGGPSAGAFGSTADFVAAYMPALRGVPRTDAHPDCWVEAADGEFIIGPVSEAENVYAAAGWGGSLCAFAPWIGLVLAQLAIDQDTSYDIARFSPARFA